MPFIRSVAEIVEQKGEQDVLADVLRAVRLSAAIFYDNEARSPWVTATPTMDEIAHALMPEHELVIPFHMITMGSCWAELWDDPASAIQLNEGDVVILARGDHHFLASSPGMRAETNPSGYARPPLMPKHGSVNEAAGGPPTCRFVCAFVGCDARPFNPLFDALPRMFRARTSQATQAFLATLVRAALDESEQRLAGNQTMLARLAELIFLEVIREHMDELSQESRSWLSGLRDRHVGAALRLIHGRPAEAWTLESVSPARLASRGRVSPYALPNMSASRPCNISRVGGCSLRPAYWTRRVPASPRLLPRLDMNPRRHSAPRSRNGSALHPARGGMRAQSARQMCGRCSSWPELTMSQRPRSEPEPDDSKGARWLVL